MTYKGIVEKINNIKETCYNYSSAEHMLDNKFVSDTLINFCGLSCNTLENIMFTMRQKNSMRFAFHD